MVLDVADIQRIMGISRLSAYELVCTPGLPVFRRGRLIKVSKIAFFEWMAKGSEIVPKSNK
ncbi:helix-turn-helix domain-containing protein [Lachnoclostridium edouardi]|uniref:helix-turn-helix domain-containing protein n=1 Tax=Lachnoclostridium edouardi TaxID=1926283 RepID=UPI002E8DD6B2|nr:helix-turn-helix domain-containing protein [Lachnoclostridium edouardi]